MEVIMSGVPYIIFRPTGIYGPRDHDYFLMLESLQKGFSFGAGYRRQLLTFIYGPDLAQAALEALLKAPANSTYLLSEERCYTQKEYRRMAAGALGKKHVCSITVPLWGVKIVSAIAQKSVRHAASPPRSTATNITSCDSATGAWTPRRHNAISASLRRHRWNRDCGRPWNGADRPDG